MTVTPLTHLWIDMIIDIGNRRYYRRFDIYPRVPATGKWVRVLHDHEIGRDRDAKRIPSTVRFHARPNYPDFISTPSIVQWWWHGLLKFVSGLPDSIILDVWGRVTSNHVAFTDNNSRDNGYRDHVLGVNMGAEDFRVASLTTSGNLLEVIESSGAYWKVKAMNFNGVLPSYEEVLTRPGLIHWATEVRGKVVSNFPDFEGYLNAPFGLPVPNPSLAGTQYIAKELVVEVPNNAEYVIYSNGLSF